MGNMITVVLRYQRYGFGRTDFRLLSKERFRERAAFGDRIDADRYAANAASMVKRLLT